MRKQTLMLLAAVIGLAASQASAADLPRKAPAYVPPPAPPPITWTGCYIGANIGGAFGQGRVEANDFFGGDLTNNGSGFAGGGQIGCDYQWAGGWVIGFRNMFDGTSNKRSRTFFDNADPPNAFVANFNNQWFDTLTGRLGYAVAPTWLLYVQGGGAWAHTSTNLTFNNVQIGQTGNTRSGWTVGGGVEWMFAPHWSAFLEGNWMDFGTKTFAVDPNLITCVVCSASVRASEATVLVGVNWRPW
jgi:outer membrane immunogenic protein